MPKISIVVLTYNHEKFIQQTLTSIFEQEVDFNYEILVIDDGSTDQTISIVEKIASTHHQVKLFSSTKNKGVKNSVLTAYQNLNGEYLAILDGDDYWNSPYKLKEQINFLDQNEDFVGSYHDAKIQNDVVKGNQYFSSQKTYSQRYYYTDTLHYPEIINRKVIIPSSSLILRTDSLKQINLNLFLDNLSIEWKLMVMACRGSRLKYFNETWSVYRNHDTGISKWNKEKFHLSHILFLESLLAIDDYKEYHYEIYHSIAYEIRILLENKNENNIVDKTNLFKKYKKYQKRELKLYKKRIETGHI